MDYSQSLIYYFTNHRWVEFYKIIDTFTVQIMSKNNIYLDVRDDIKQDMRYYALKITRIYCENNNSIKKFKEYLTTSMRHEILDIVMRNKYHYFIKKRSDNYYKNKSYEELLEYIYYNTYHNSIHVETTAEHVSLIESINKLGYPQNAIVKLYYGIEEDKNYTLDEIAKILNLSHRATVYNLLKKALNNLKGVLEEE